jgi:hypothetical protein
MRTPKRVKTKAPRQQVCESRSMPPPIGGWNARDPLAQMKPTDAVVLQNWFPNTSYVEIRGGYASHATGMTGNGKTLMVYNALSGTNKMFCATASGIYDVSSAGAVGASVLARTNGKHQVTMFGDGTSNWLIAPNGVDAPAYYDGTTWTAVTGATSPALTGLTTTEIISVNVHQGRLFFIPKNSLSFWYLAAGAAGGALTEFDLSAECQKGGYLMAMISWTRDAGDGQDDVAAFITSEGQCIIYQGNNPGSAAAWAKVGAFSIGKPLGRRCAIKYGGDVVILTENGTFELSKALQSVQHEQGKLALSYKIEKAFTSAALTYGDNFGWEATIYPAQSALIVNIPFTEDAEHEQYVMNTITKAWCRFTEWDAECFGVFNGELYFASGTTVNKAWTGQIDGEDNIEAYGKQAFSYFGNEGQVKQFKLFRPVLAVNGSLNYLTDIDVDFADDPISGTATYVVVSGAVWDASNWDEAFWASGLTVVKQWTSPAEWQGYCAAGKVKIATNSLLVQWMASDYVYETGGIL